MSGSAAIPAYGFTAVVEPTPDILWLKVNENTGTTTADASGAGNNFTVGVDGSNCLWETGTKSGSGSSIYTNAASAGVTWGHSTATINFGSANVITICYWIYLVTNGNSGLGADNITFELTSNSNSNNHAFFIEYRSSDAPKTFKASIHDGTGSLQGTIPATAETSGPPPTAAGWHHIVWVLDNSTNGGTMKAWTDGVSQTVTNTLNTKSANGIFVTDTLYAGSRAATNLFLAAGLDDIRIYGRELTSAEIALVYADPQ